MVFCNFIKHSKYSTTEKLQFFQSAHPYLRSHAIIKYSWFRSRRWNNPHPSTSYRNFLSIDSGHYGLYYTVYNHDAERKKQGNPPYLGDTLLSFLISEGRSDKWFFDYATSFFISKANKDIHNNISQIKMISKKFLSTLAVIAPKHHGHHSKWTCPTRSFSTLSFAKNKKMYLEKLEQKLQPQSHQYQSHQNHNHQQNQDPNQPQDDVMIYHTQKTQNDAAIDFIQPVLAPETTDSVESNESPESFESHFLHSQLSSILEIYNTFSKPEDLNVIYPLYQSLKRNEIALPTIELYNVVLNSISKRSLDSEQSLEAIESKLTNLLTIYQDILQSSEVKPNNETYDIVIANLFEGSMGVSTLSSSNTFAYYAHMSKAKEFGQIGIELFGSIQKKDQLDLNHTIPQILQFLVNYPDLINKSIIEDILPYISKCVGATNERYYYNLMEIVKYFPSIGIFEADPKATYKFILSIYEQFKESNFKSLDEYKMYSKLIATLIFNDQFVLASKFLDDILSDYKLSAESNFKPKKSQISMVMSSYISAIINNKPEDLEKGYELLAKFNGIGYLPELSNELYNELIVKFVEKYHQGEIERSNLHKLSSDVRMPSKEQILNEKQNQRYQTIWSLYNYIAIRKDYQEVSTIKFLESSTLPIHCRDLILSLSIDVGDHERIFQLIKEVLLKNHLIFDLTGLKKLLSYLYNGVIYNANGQPFNQYYFGLVWNLVESQAVHYSSSSKDLHDYLSELVNFLLVPNSHSMVELNEYNIRLFMNSKFLDSCVNKFDLHLDNIYGLIVISKVLMAYQGHDRTVYNQIVQFQAKLINSFEDADNHYVEFNPDVVEYKNNLISHFKYLLTGERAEALEFNPTIEEASQACNIELPTRIGEASSSRLSYDLNLSYLLNVNYDVGMEKFVESFKKGYTFNSLTWEIVLNHGSLNELAKANSQIRISDLIDRIWQSKFDVEMKLNHLTTLINSNIDKINIKVVEFLNNSDLQIPQNDNLSTVLVDLVAAIGKSENVYLKGVLAQKTFFDKMFQIDSSLVWVSQYFELLIREKKYEQCIEILEEHQLLPKSKQSKISNTELEILIAGLSAYLESNNVSKFASTFRDYFMDADLLKRSPQLVNLLIQYYLNMGGSGNIEVVLKRFDNFKGLSKQTNESIWFTKVLNSLQREPVQVEEAVSLNASSINELSLRLLSSNDLVRMKQLYYANQNLISNNASKSALVDKILGNMVNASLQRTSDSQISSSRFQLIIRILKVIGFRYLSVEQLRDVIKLLTVTKARETLHVLLAKLLNGTSSASIVNFYFMETSLLNEGDRFKILNLMNKSFKHLHDPISLSNVEQFCKSNRVQLEAYNEEEFREELSVN